MQKQGPSIARILTMVVFALSCFGLLMFLWVSFGGPVPLQPEGYRFKVPFQEAATLAPEADVRIAGVNVGTVKGKELDKGGASTIAEIEMDERYAPIPEDTRAILRQKTLLGETYVELTPGDPATGMLAEGGSLGTSNVEQTVELDEILRIFSPVTKESFRRWIDYSAKAIEGSASQDFNSALGNLPTFTATGSEVLGVLDQQDRAVEQLIRNTGVVFGALNEQEGALRDLILNSENTFDAIASEQVALEDTIQIFPTFLEESRLTLDRLEEFSRDTNPLVNDLKPVADDLGPTVADLGDLSPDLRSVLLDFTRGGLIASADRSLPDAENVLRGARPVFRGLHTFLPELNPILSFANFYRGGLADFIAGGGPVTLNSSLPSNPGDPTPIKFLPQTGLIGSNSDDFQVQEQRPFVRGNSYIPPGGFFNRPRPGPTAVEAGVIPSFSCSNNPGGEQRNPSIGSPDPTDEDVNEPPCVEAGDYGWPDGGQYPLLRGRQQPLRGGGRVPRPTPYPLPGDGLGSR